MRRFFTRARLVRPEAGDALMPVLAGRWKGSRGHGRMDPRKDRPMAMCLDMATGGRGLSTMSRGWRWGIASIGKGRFPLRAAYGTGIEEKPRYCRWEASDEE